MAGGCQCARHCCHWQHHSTGMDFVSDQHHRWVKHSASLSDPNFTRCLRKNRQGRALQEKQIGLAEAVESNIAFRFGVSTETFLDMILSSTFCTTEPPILPYLHPVFVIMLGPCCAHVAPLEGFFVYRKVLWRCHLTVLFVSNLRHRPIWFLHGPPVGTIIERHMLGQRRPVYAWAIDVFNMRRLWRPCV